MKYLVLAFILVSCASYKPEPVEEVKPHYSINVDAVSAPNAKAFKKFRVVGKESKSLRFRHYANVTRAILERQGFIYSESHPDINIDLSYSISEPKVEVEEDEYTVHNYSTQAVKDQWGNQIGTVSGLSPSTQTVRSETTTYDRKVTLAAFSARNKKMLWETKMTSSGWNGNLKEVFPYMVLAGTEYIGQSPEAPVESSIAQDDVRVTGIK